MSEGIGFKEEDDYMGDLSLFIRPEEGISTTITTTTSASAPFHLSSSQFTTTRPINSDLSRRNPRISKREGRRRLQREQKQIEEDERTVANLETAIPQSNIGFRLLKQMGYSPGSALGKHGGEGGRLVEPLGVQIRRSRAGIGREDPHKERKRLAEARVEMKRVRDDDLLVGFGVRQKSLWKSRRTLVNYNKAKGALLQLENVEVVEPKNDDDDCLEEAEEEEEEEVVTEEELVEMLMKLRNEYHYCLFCGVQYESMEALQSECPGLNEDDH